jgi:glycosyltransferase involved in cell wall biosynthesis
MSFPGEPGGPARIPLVIHATHEAGLKLGGIGAVLEGLLSSPAYNAAVGRTILVGPVNTFNPTEMERLAAPGNRLRIIYSTVWGLWANQASEAIANALRAIEERMNVHLLYGVRAFGGFEHEVILVDAGAIAGEVINSYKYHLWSRWGLPAGQHEGNWEFSFYLNAGEPLFAAADAIAAIDISPAAQRFIIAHEWLGLPVAFSARLRDDSRYRTIFYSHEVATARLLVEENGGHDTRFYNVLRLGLSQGANLDQVFGDHSWFYKHAMLLRAGVCDRILAVSDVTHDELRFLGGTFASAPVDVVYNGVPAPLLSYEQKLASRELMLRYCENLYGFRPDYIFTHVTRLVTSKAVWRDLRVLEHLEWTLAAHGKRAVFFLVSTAVPTGRRPEDIYRWESEYGWPVSHRGDNGDLQGDEARLFFNALEPFHWGRSAIRICLVNQFGWDRSRCGWRMPEEMRFTDLRAGTDLEFGQSIYEPFGIAQIEPLSAGALCVPSSVCGCMGFLDRASGGQPPGNIITGDYVYVPPEWGLGSPWDALRIDQAVRDSIEARESYAVAQRIWERLPKNEDDERRLLSAGQQAASALSWEVVVRDYLLPALSRAR